MEQLIVAAEICEDVWSPIPAQASGAALEGATVIVNCSASDETIGKDVYRRELIQGQSARLIAGYIYANAGEGESTTDLVFGGHSIIAENGSILKGGEAILQSGNLFGDRCAESHPRTPAEHDISDERGENARPCAV